MMPRSLAGKDNVLNGLTFGLVINDKNSVNFTTENGTNNLKMPSEHPSFTQ